MTVCLDIWGGEGSQDHIARYMLPIDEALTLARSELADGYLINLRQEAAWSPKENFDTRRPS